MLRGDVVADKKRKRGCKVKRLSNKKTTKGHKFPTHNGLDAHAWATKMEMRRLVEGKPDLKLKETD